MNVLTLQVAVVYGFVAIVYVAIAMLFALLAHFDTIGESYALVGQTAIGALLGMGVNVRINGGNGVVPRD